MRVLPSLLVLSALLSGCFIDRAGALRTDAGPGADASTWDASAFDASPGLDAGSGLDAGVSDAGASDADPGLDVGPEDAELADAGPGCTAADEGCDGEVAIRCTGSGLVREPCADLGAFFCEAGACVAQVCAPSALRCSGDGADVMVCTSRGDGFTRQERCTRGCAGAACRPARSCPMAIEHTMDEGTYVIDLCGHGDDQTPDGSVSGDDCGTIFPGEDVVVRLELATPGRFRLDLVDWDSGRRIDPILYLRDVCDEQETQIECDDDSGSGYNSQIVRNLGAGDYFVVLDSLIYDRRGRSYRCGQVRFEVTRL